MKKYLLLLSMFLCSLFAGAQTQRGDVNNDGTVDVADVTALVDIILNGSNDEGGDEEYEGIIIFEDWTSTNGGESNSTSQTKYTFDVETGTELTFDWSVSSESDYDKLIITLDGSEILNKSGEQSGSYEYSFPAAGSHTLVVQYTKDGSVDNGNDQATISNITLASKPAGDDEEDEVITPTPSITTVEAVDLGLSVKWATCNVGAIDPWEYGGYYAWGETEEKSDYSWETYKYCRGTYTSMTKYCTDSYNGTVDDKTVLEPADDVATVKWGGAWRMPTKAEQDELRNNCTWTWTTLNGVNGYQVTGPSGNSIFLPAAGYRAGEEVDNQGYSGRCWSSTLSSGSSDLAYYLYFDDGECDWINWDRYLGHTVRPVCE